MLETIQPYSDAVTSPCEAGKPERPRYFPRQLITPEEMNLEQTYFRDRMRRHNRLLHGWGVVCGARVCPVPSPDALRRTKTGRSGHGASGGAGEEARPHQEDCGPCPGWEPWKIMVEPGYILGPYGDEIMIDARVIVDLRQRCTARASGDCWSQAPDPWCSDVRVSELESPLFIAVRYKEIMTRPVRIPPPGCGCQDLECDYSRWCDGYEICTIDECPESHRGDPVDEPDGLPGCPPCPDDPWVVLARIEFDPETGCVTAIDNCSCRRLVRSHACYWWRCDDPPREVPASYAERYAIRHVGGGYYEIGGFAERVRSRERAEAVARALAEGLDPVEVLEHRS